MYANSMSKKKKQKGRKLTPDAIKYKKFITREIENQKGLYGIDNILQKEEIFYIVDINLVVPIKKDGTINESHLKDLDNLIKGLQDCLTGTVFKDDNQVRSFFPTIYYNKEPITKITLDLYTYNDEKHRNLKELIKQELLFS